MAMIRLNHGNGTYTEFQGDPKAVAREAADDIRRGRMVLNRQTGRTEFTLGVVEGGNQELLDGYVFPDGVTLAEVQASTEPIPPGEPIEPDPVNSDDPSAAVEAQLADGTQPAADDDDQLVEPPAMLTVEIVPGTGGAVNIVVDNPLDHEVVLWRDTGSTGTIAVAANSRLNRRFKNHGKPVHVRLGSEDGEELAWLPGELEEISADEE